MSQPGNRFVSFVRGEAKLCVPVRRVASRGWAFDLRKVLRGAVRACPGWGRLCEWNQSASNVSGK